MNIIVLDGFTLNPGDNSWSPIESLHGVNVKIYDRSSEDEIAERCHHADIILTNKTPISAETLSKLPQLKFISVLATGFNIVDIKAAEERNIPVSNVPEYATNAVAQYVFAVLLSLIHRPEQHDFAVKAGEWSRCKDFSFQLFPVMELAGKTMGIIGMGKTGSAVARLAYAFGMQVISYHPSKTASSEADFYRWCSLEEIFSNSDVISLHCPQTEKTTGLINETALNRMKPSALLINAARGALINEQDLADALNSRQIAGAALDVLSMEPPELGNPLLNAQNCLITPHLAWTALEARQRLMQQTRDNIQAFIEGNPVNVIHA